MLIWVYRVFAIANDTTIAVTALPQSQPIMAPLWLVLLIVFAAGILVISLIASLRLSALRLKVHRLEKRLNTAEAKLSDQEAGASALTESA